MKPSGSALGLHFDKNNNLIIASSDTRGGPQGIRRHNLKSGETTVITDNYKGKNYVAPNIVTSDVKGRIYFTNARYGGKTLSWELPNAVYRIDLGGTVTQISIDMEIKIIKLPTPITLVFLQSVMQRWQALRRKRTI